MPPVYLKALNGKIFQDNIVVLKSFESPILTTKSPSSGRWYYEVTHLEGDYGGIYGFAIGNSDKGFHIAQTDKDYSFVWHYEGFKFYNSLNNEPIPEYTRIDLPDITSGYTIGLGFDSFSRLFSIYYQNYDSFQYHKYFKLLLSFPFLPRNNKTDHK